VKWQEIGVTSYIQRCRENSNNKFKILKETQVGMRSLFELKISTAVLTHRCKNHGICTD